MAYESASKTTIQDVQPAMAFTVGACQSYGKRYDHNEDSIFTMDTLLATDNGILNFGLFIVADGMGGHAKGEEASSRAIQAMVEHVLRHLFLPMVNPAGFSQPEPVQEVLENGMRRINEQLLVEIPDGGTTMTAMIILGNYLTIGHAGDSRAYLIDEQGDLEQLTKDQTLVQRLVDLGQLSLEEGRNYNQKNVLYSALGQNESVDIQLSTRRIPQAGYLILCSDGVTVCVDDDTIKSIVSSSAHPQEASERLIADANAAGGPDNISAIVIKVH
ncbi:MAG TPA: serine/threonine-protein phosphatase [Chloroflexi bacterium]|nr:serine/threonine-protein phosphatase [Chloroflexota bacterium]